MATAPPRAPTMTARFQLIEEPMPDVLATFAKDVERGLSQTAKELNCRWFYDEEGSQLFDAICGLDEYYLWRAEHEILKTNAAAIAAEAPKNCTLIELGSGTASKTRLLIDALIQRSGSLVYAPIDVSSTVLKDSSRALLDAHPQLSMLAIAAEYDRGLEVVKQTIRGPKLFAWLGSNVGNFDRPRAAAFLSRVKRAMSEGDRLLLGVDLRKSKAILEPAYDDKKGVTARFNKNLLVRINADLGGDFDLDAFRHRAVYDEREGTIRMYLDSLASQRVHIAKLGRTYTFEKNEAVHTEDSYKYGMDEIDQLARGAGLSIRSKYTDRESRFADIVLA